MTHSILTLTGAFLVLLLAGPAFADDGRPVGQVSTVFKFLTPNDKIKVAAFEDPKIQGVTCFISRAVTGGLKGAFGIAEDTSDASISCHQTGPIRFKDKIRPGEKGEEVFNERRSLLFKELHVTRFYDQASNTLVYLTWSDRIIEGSPKNSLSAVTLMTWDGQAAETPKLK
jgi:CreA protein